MFGKKKEEEPTPMMRAMAKAFFALTDKQDYATAASSYREAYQLCGTSTVKELGLRAEICFGYGHALRLLYDLEAISPRRPPTEAQEKAMVQVNRVWTELLDIVSRIPADAYRLDANLIDQIRKHWTMSD